MSTAELKSFIDKLAISQAETNKQMSDQRNDLRDLQKETALMIQSMTKSIERMSGSIGREWGDLVESLTKASCLQQMQAWGIEVTQTSELTESDRKGYEQEWDTLLINSGELVAVEVKSRFQVKYLKDIEEKLVNFKKAFTQYANYKVYGAVAALKYDAGSARLAEKSGYFVFEPSGDIMKIINRADFKPKAW